MRSSILLATALVFACSAPTAEAPEYSLPPEWEPHEAVWFTYTGIALDTVLDHMLMQLDTSTLAVCVIDGDSIAFRIRARWDSLGIPPSRYRIEPGVDSLLSPVVRDAGPIFLRRREGGLAVLDQAWNTYGDLNNEVRSSAAQRALEDSFPVLYARRLGVPVVRTPLVIEGGACEINGRGDLLQVEAVTLQRNPGWSMDSIANELERLFGAQRIIWLKEGMPDDAWHLEPRVHGNVYTWATGGHVDEFCRFVNDSTVLLAWPEDHELVDPVHAMARRRMEVNERILHAAGLLVVRAPVPVLEMKPLVLDSLKDHHARLLSRYPDVHHRDTVLQVPAASYLNFLITNGRVFVPAYWHEGMPEVMRAKDERMQVILKQHFPDRRIVPVDPRAINKYGGGMHCWTQQQPRLKE